MCVLHIDDGVDAARKMCAGTYFVRVLFRSCATPLDTSRRGTLYVYIHMVDYAGIVCLLSTLRGHSSTSVHYTAVQSVGARSCET